MSNATISPDLLEILRCPYCVSGETRLPGDDPGRLDLVRDGTWLVSKESGFKYPIKEGIPVMLIEEGQKWQNTPIEELPDPGPLVDPSALTMPDTPFTASGQTGPDLRLLLALAALLAVVGVLMALLLSRRNRG